MRKLGNKNIFIKITLELYINATILNVMKTKTRYLANQYGNMKQRVNGKDPKSKYYLGLPIMTYTQYIYWALDDIIFNQIWEVYERMGFNTKYCPSIDRIDNSKGYILNNIRFVFRYQNTKQYNGKNDVALTNSKTSFRLVP